MVVRPRSTFIFCSYKHALRIRYGYASPCVHEQKINMRLRALHHCLFKKTDCRCVVCAFVGSASSGISVSFIISSLNFIIMYRSSFPPYSVAAFVLRSSRSPIWFSLSQSLASGSRFPASFWSRFVSSFGGYVSGGCWAVLPVSTYELFSFWSGLAPLASCPVVGSGSGFVGFELP